MIKLESQCPLIFCVEYMYLRSVFEKFEHSSSETGTMNINACENNQLQVKYCLSNCICSWQSASSFVCTVTDLWVDPELWICWFVLCYLKEIHCKFCVDFSFVVLKKKQQQKMDGRSVKTRESIRWSMAMKMVPLNFEEATFCGLSNTTWDTCTGYVLCLSRKTQISLVLLGNKGFSVSTAVFDMMQHAVCCVLYTWNICWAQMKMYKCSKVKGNFLFLDPC